MEAIVSTRGRVTIPEKLRRKYEIKQGTRIVLEQKGRTIEMRPITAAYIESLQGILQTRPGEKPMTQELVEEHAAEVLQEKGYEL